MKWLFFLLCCLPLMLLAQATSGPEVFDDKELFEDVPSAPNYALPDYWAALPDRRDAADLLPTPLATEREEAAEADVFYLYPTIYTGRKKAWNADLQDQKLNKRVDSTAIKYQATIFNAAGWVYAPRYRQAHISAFFTKDKATAQRALELAYRDVKTAFSYYLEHYNKGRPIVLAGHSQGALMVKWLLRDFFDGKPLQNQLVVAYVVGWPVYKTDFDSVPVCETAEQTACFCSWRTFKYGFIPKKFPVGDSIAVTNPISWTTKPDYVPSSMSKGSVLRNFDKIYFQSADAQVHQGVLWSRLPKFPGRLFVLTRNYHPADLNLFYLDVRENAKTRVEAFLRGR